MATAITPILSNFTLVLAEVVDGLGAVVTFITGNPLMLISVGITVSSLIFRVVRSYTHH